LMDEAPPWWDALFALAKNPVKSTTSKHNGLNS
jgi:hypothetical protein